MHDCCRRTVIPGGFNRTSPVKTGLIRAALCAAKRHGEWWLWFAFEVGVCCAHHLVLHDPKSQCPDPIVGRVRKSVMSDDSLRKVFR